MLRWQIAFLVATAIAISYLDRQALPVAIQAIARDIPVTNEQFSQLQSAFPVLSNPANRHRTVSLTAIQFHYACGNMLTEEESDALHVGLF